MGKFITILQRKVENIAGKNKFALRVGGGIIAIAVVLASGASGWLIERLIMQKTTLISFYGYLFLLLGLASSLATRSLRDSVVNVLNPLSKLSSTCPESLEIAREKLSFIVGRDVSQLSEDEILRATAETASENSVDGIYAPLFWMFFGSFLWELSNQLPGPLALAWAFKASSTLDSMLGYRVGKLKWLGTFGARLDDVLTWIPCRIVVFTLPFISKPLHKIPGIINNAFIDGRKDPSPNSGLSESIFAYCCGITMGGLNVYQGKEKLKPKIASHEPKPSIRSIEKLLNLILNLELFWLATILIIKYLTYLL